jgi:serine/threonine protein phosphatase PrpC
MEMNSFSAKGKRENNEDYILSCQLSSDGSLYLVADGMGGYSFGEIASSLACESIAEYITNNHGRFDVKQLITDSLNVANTKINEKRKQLSVKMGTTLAGVLIEGSLAYLFWLGDVRIYHFRESAILFQSEDHSFINKMKKKGNVSTKEIERYGNIVTKSLSGLPEEGEVEIVELSLIPGDVLIVCSDGFWKKVHVPSIYNLPIKEIQNQVNGHLDEMDDNYSMVKISV